MFGLKYIFVWLLANYSYDNLLKTYNSYNGRNPKTGETILVPKKILPIFRPSKDLLTKLNKKKG